MKVTSRPARARLTLPNQKASIVWLRGRVERRTWRLIFFSHRAPPHPLTVIVHASRQKLSKSYNTYPRPLGDRMNMDRVITLLRLPPLLLAQPHPPHRHQISVPTNLNLKVLTSLRSGGEQVRRVDRIHIGVPACIVLLFSISFLVYVLVFSILNLNMMYHVFVCRIQRSSQRTKSQFYK